MNRPGSFDRLRRALLIGSLGCLGTALVGLGSLTPAPAHAQVPLPDKTVDVAEVGEEQRTTLNLYLLPQQAHAFVTQHKGKVLFLDVRTRAEAVFIGMATAVDALAPYVEFPEMHSDWTWDKQRDAYRYEPFNDFAPEVERRLKEKGLTKNDPVVVMCRSGDRSSRAANLLADLGYKRVYSVVGGFEGPLNEATGRRDLSGWKNAQLPWSHELDQAKMYFVR